MVYDYGCHTHLRILSLIMINQPETYSKPPVTVLPDPVPGNHNNGTLAADNVNDSELLQVATVNELASPEKATPQNQHSSDNVSEDSTFAKDSLSVSRVNTAFTADSMRRKLRADSFYHALTLEQQNQLVDWIVAGMDFSTLRDRILQPLPNGLGLKIHPTTLLRLQAKIIGESHAHLHTHILDTVHDLESSSQLFGADRIQRAISQLLHDQAFELARTNAHSKTFSRLLTSIEKLAALDYKRQKLLLDLAKSDRQAPASTQHHRVDFNIVRPNIHGASEEVSPNVEHPQKERRSRRMLAVESSKAV